MLYDATVNGEQRKIVGHFGRNGFYYTLEPHQTAIHQGRSVLNDLN